MIFRNIVFVKQVAKCRLVCKRWDRLAEMIITTEKITLDSEEIQTIKLYGHLSKDASMGKWGN